MTALFALLASTTFILWCSVAFIIAMAILLENEFEGWATTICSLGLALWIWNFGGTIWGYLSASPLTTLGFAIGYVVIGIIWSFLKWTTYVKSIFEKFKDIKVEFLLINHEITDKNRSRFNEKIREGFLGKYVSSDDSIEVLANKITPIASKKKSVITSWISYWPVSLLATLLNNPFRRFFEWVYSNLSGYYDKITNSYKKDAFGI